MRLLPPWLRRTSTITRRTAGRLARRSRRRASASVESVVSLYPRYTTRPPSRVVSHCVWSSRCSHSGGGAAAGTGGSKTYPSAETYAALSTGRSATRRPPAKEKVAAAVSVIPSPRSTSSVTTYSGRRFRRLHSLSRGISGRTSRTTRATGTPSIATSLRPTRSGRSIVSTTWSPSAKSYRRRGKRCNGRSCAGSAG